MHYNKRELFIWLQDPHTHIAPNHSSPPSATAFWFSLPWCFSFQERVPKLVLRFILSSFTTLLFLLPYNFPLFHLGGLLFRFCAKFLFNISFSFLCSSASRKRILKKKKKKSFVLCFFKQAFLLFLPPPSSLINSESFCSFLIGSVHSLSQAAPLLLFLGF